VLSDQDIADALVSGEISVEPYDPRRLQPVSIDVTLGDTVRVFDRAMFREVELDAIPDDLTEVEDIRDGFRLRPGDFILATTAETLTLGPGIAARLEGKSTLGRLGIAVHATAGLIDPGFSGQVTLEVSNVGTLVPLLRPGLPIGQLTFEATSSPCLVPYGSDPALGSHYQGQTGPTPPRSVRLFAA
jgi:dCTP deaminase